MSRLASRTARSSTPAAARSLRIACVAVLSTATPWRAEPPRTCARSTRTARFVMVATSMDRRRSSAESSTSPTDVAPTDVAANDTSARDDASDVADRLSLASARFSACTATGTSAWAAASASA
eukprot:6200198-Pleurochrysis_carterae.AAC.3